ncbi:MAG: hypothetical protein HC802_14950 [Caldilineaceae bacterium]|nr:hypothetical protein [Caldilineaceae bacterium]
MVDRLPAQPSLLSASPSYAEITFVRARHSGDNVWTFDVTLAHPDTGWDDYADGWHVATPDQRILGTRILLHPHVGEQPFTRSLSSVRLGPDVDQVVIRSHDLVDGYGPQTVTLSLAQSNSGDGYEVIR